MTERTRCAVIGGGPAGMVAGLLLARAGVDVTVLEKHGDFLRDFRGDTVHPVTMRLLDELGLFERFDAQPHPYVAMVPQWDLLDLIADAAAEEPSFTLRVRHEVTGLLRDGDRISGV